MIRDYINSAAQKKYFLMFFTSVIYILGLFAYFSQKSIEFSFVLLIIAIFAILKNYISPKLALFWYFVFFFAFFNANLRIKNYDTLYQIAPKDAVITGQITSIPSGINGREKFFFNVKKISYDKKEVEIKAKTYINMIPCFERSRNKCGMTLNIGDTYIIKGKLRPPFKASNPSQFDYGKYLKNFGVFTLFYAQDADFKKLDTKLSPKWAFLQGLNNIRNQILTTHAKYLKSPNLEILGGIVFGDDAVAPPDYIKKAFINSGLLHILAASGMNVAIIYGIWFFILRKLKVPFNITVSSGIFVIIFYALMTGLGPSVIRAAIMLIFVLLGKLIDRDAHSLSLLSFVALLMLIYNPAYINDVGFQLSFLVTFGLLTTAPVVFERLKRVPNWLSGAVFIPIVAQIWIAPLQMYYFNSFSLYSVFANIAIMPFVSIVSFGGFISSVIAMFKPVADITCFVFDSALNPVLNALVAISQYFSNLPHSLVITPQPNDFQMILYYFLVVLITLLFKFGREKRIITATIISLAVLFILYIPLPDKDFETIVFDVQNADAFLIKTPKNKYFIIDSGKQGFKGGKSQADFIILAYLKDKGIKNIEGLILTHFDSDHAGGAVDLIKNLGVNAVYLNSLDDKSPLAQKIYNLAKNKKVKTFAVKNNEIIYFEPDFKIKTFISGIKNSDNENSVITLVSRGDFDELFMGDAGVEAFGKIAPYMPDIEVLKVGHHGARNVVDKKMIEKLKPEVALISTGPNHYGHPSGVTLDVLQSQNVKVFITEKQNSLKVENSKNGYKIKSYDSRNGKYIEKSGFN
ncbi:MAG TPA: DNA internalization-related competence protein ComEC/Rec2 [Candidatus Gastranaerophilaceae bacterium]|nr:DNA internalization-related competence protein ComEC/Rec2 [Candidatus Gastranaerophilaceae bacterium]